MAAILIIFIIIGFAVMQGYIKLLIIYDNYNVVKFLRC